MKLRYFLFAAVAMMGTLTACEDLDTAPEGATLTTDQKAEIGEAMPQRAEAGVRGIFAQFNVYAPNYDAFGRVRHNDFGYSSIMMFTDGNTEDVVSADNGYNWCGNDLTYDDRPYTSEESQMVWNDYYSIIFNANNVIKNLDPESQDPVSQFYLAQALAARGFCYLELAQLYQFNYKGHEQSPCVPLITDENSDDAAANGAPRATVQAVYDLVNADLSLAIDLLTIRAQAKAVYSTYNIGHYGLAFTHYTHFTSPIRRYPDLMVHRLVEKYILTGKKETLTREELEEKCEHCSACEQEAAQAERDSIKLFQAMWMSDHIGEVLPGHISGVTDFGLFVQLDESRCEGLIHVSNIGEKGEYWQYDEKNFRLVCENKNHTSPESPKSYTLGDPVTVKVVRADVNRAQIDFEFA